MLLDLSLKILIYGSVCQPIQFFSNRDIKWVIVCFCNLNAFRYAVMNFWSLHAMPFYGLSLRGNDLAQQCCYAFEKQPVAKFHLVAKGAANLRTVKFKVRKLELGGDNSDILPLVDWGSRG